MSNRLVIITGASGGIGKCVKDILLSRGHQVINLTRSPTLSEDMFMDLSSYQSVLSGLKKLKLLVNLSDYIFINNAACINPVKPLAESSPSEIMDSVNTNVCSPLLMFNFFERLKRPWDLVNLTSGASNSVNPHLGLYSSGKLFIDRFLIFLQSEKSYCRKFISHDPGICNTAIHRELKSSPYFTNDSFNSTTPKRPIDAAQYLINRLEFDELI